MNDHKEQQNPEPVFPVECPVRLYAKRQAEKYAFSLSLSPRRLLFDAAVTAWLAGYTAAQNAKASKRPNAQGKQPPGFMGGLLDPVVSTDSGE